MKLYVLLALSIQCATSYCGIDAYLDEVTFTAQKLDEYVDDITISSGSSFGWTGTDPVFASHQQYTSHNRKALPAMYAHFAARNKALFVVGLYELCTALGIGALCGFLSVGPMEITGQPVPFFLIGLASSALLAKKLSSNRYAYRDNMPFYTDLLEHGNDLLKSNTFGRSIVSTIFAMGCCGLFGAAGIAAKYNQAKL